VSTPDYFYNITKSEDAASVTVFAGLDQYVASGDTANYDKIVEAVLHGAPLSEVEGLFDLAKPLSDKFARLTDRVTVQNGAVYFDGDVQEGPVTDAIIRFYNENNDYSFVPLVNFLEKVGQNPNEHSREHLGRWLANESFSLDSLGNIIAYKGVYEDDEVYRPSHNGPGVSVNDVPVADGEYAFQRDGDTVSMARSDVEFDPAVGCSRGLHVGTFNYAQNFTSYVVEVSVNPRDVVSVPTDCGDQKMRTCKYEVIGHVETERDTIFSVTLEPEYEDQNPEDDSDWEDDECGPDCEVCNWLQEEKEAGADTDDIVARLEGFAVGTDPMFEVVGFLFYSDDEEGAILKQELMDEGVAEEDIAIFSNGEDTYAKIDNKEGTNVSDSKQDYANYKKDDFKSLTRTTLRTIAKAWGVKAPAPGNKSDLVKALARKAGDIRWNRKRGQGFQG
jgi:hypothetical protein